MSKIIDWHNHWFSPRVVELLEQRGAAPRIERNDRGEKIFISNRTSTTLAPLPIALGFLSVDERIRHLDEVGVDEQVVSWPTTLGADAVLSAEEAKPLWRAYNQDLSALVQKHPDRFHGLAVLPTSDIDWAADELEYAHRELGLIGAVLPVGGLFSLAGARQLAPIFEVAQKNRSHIYLHTGPASQGIGGQLRFPALSPEEPAGVRWTLDSYTQFAGAILTLTLTDFLDPYPDVSIQVAMLGGAVSFLAEGLELRSRQLGFESVRTALRRVYIDTGVVGRGPHVLSLAAKTFGADRILFGSDYPLIDIGPTLRSVAQANLSDGERHQILSGNGAELLASKSTAAAVT